MTEPFGASYGRSKLFKVAKGTADGSGNATLTFDRVSSGYVWTGTMYCQDPQPNIGLFLAFRNNTQYLGQWSGSGMLHGVQAADGADVTVSVQGQVAGSQVTLVWTGAIDSMEDAPVSVPSVAGPSGLQLVASSALFPVNIQQAPLAANVLSAEVDSDQGTGATVLVAGINGSRLRLWSATLSMAMAELAATVGVKSWSCDIEVHGGTPVILKMPLRTVPGNVAAGSVSQNCYGLTLPNNTGLDLNSPANTADGSRVVGTVLYDVITP